MRSLSLVLAIAGAAAVTSGCFLLSDRSNPMGFVLANETSRVLTITVEGVDPPIRRPVGPGVLASVTRSLDCVGTGATVTDDTGAVVATLRRPLCDDLAWVIYSDGTTELKDTSD